MKKSEEKKIKKGFEATVKEVWGQGKKDDSMVGEGNKSKHKEDHKVAQELESRAQPEGVQIHPTPDLQQGYYGSSPGTRRRE